MASGKKVSKKRAQPNPGLAQPDPAQPHLTHCTTRNQRVNILAKIPYFFPPVNGNFLISSLFFGEKKWSNVEVCSKMARSAKILYFLFSKWVRMDKNSTKTGKNRSNYAKTGRFLGIYFSSAAEFLSCFLGR